MVKIVFNVRGCVISGCTGFIRQGTMHCNISDLIRCTMNIHVFFRYGLFYFSDFVICFSLILKLVFPSTKWISSQALMTNPFGVLMTKSSWKCPLRNRSSMRVCGKRKVHEKYIRQGKGTSYSNIKVAIRIMLSVVFLIMMMARLPMRMTMMMMMMLL